MKTLSLDQAAKRAGVSRWTVSRALQSGRLLGLRDNRGRWRIEPEPLDAWAAEQRTVLHDEQHGATEQGSAPKHGEVHNGGQDIRAERDAAWLEVAGLKAETVQLRERLDEMRARMIELQGEHDQAKLEAAVLKGETAQLRELVAEVKADRDRWHALATAPRLGFLERVRLLLRPAKVMPD